MKKSVDKITYGWYTKKVPTRNNKSTLKNKQ